MLRSLELRSQSSQEGRRQAAQKSRCGQGCAGLEGLVGGGECQGARLRGDDLGGYGKAEKRLLIGSRSGVRAQGSGLRARRAGSRQAAGA